MLHGKTFVRLLSVLLLVCMLATLLPTAALAEEDQSGEIMIVSDKAIAESDAEEAAGAIEAAVEDTNEEDDFVQAAAASYTLTFYNNDGYSTSFSRKTFNAGDTVDLGALNISFSRDPKLSSDGTYCTRFFISSWNENKSGTGTSYGLTDTFVMPEHDMALYAIWGEAEQVYWELTIEGSGSVQYQPLVVSPNSDAMNTAYPGDIVKLYVNNQRKVYAGTIHGFTPVPDTGMIFDGWYLYGDEKLDVTVLKVAQLRDLVLGNSIIEAGRNKIVARFMENDGNWASVTYRQSETGTIYYQQMVKKGDPMPTIEDPVYPNHYFLGWDQPVAATVTDDVTYTAKWLEGPTNTNTADVIYTIRCTSGTGEGGLVHNDMDCDFYYCGNATAFAYDEARGVYTCTVLVERIGTKLGVGPDCYDAFTKQEHFSEVKIPEITLVWDAADALWKPDGEQIVNVYHEDGSEPIPAEVLASLDPIICVVNSNNDTMYLAQRLIDGTYTVEYTQSTGDTRTAQVTITDFEPYVDAFIKAKGKGYVIDWDSNLHDASYYTYYLKRSLKEGSTAAGYPYVYWSSWSYDKTTTEFASTGGVLINESLVGKELRVRIPTYTISYSDPMGLLPTQSYEVAANSFLPSYDFHAEDIPTEVAEAIDAGKPVRIGDGWYSFIDWTPAPESFRVDRDYSFTAVWEPAEVFTVIFQDGLDGEVFAPVVITVPAQDGVGVLPFDGDSYEGWLFENIREDLYDVQLENGDLFIDWDQDVFEYLEFTEDLVFTAVWDKWVEVIYRDGADGEVFEDLDVGSYLLKNEELIGYAPDGEVVEPEREGYTFKGWASVADPEADMTFVDEKTGYTVNGYRETWVNDDGSEGSALFFEMVLEAQWSSDTDVTVTLNSASGVFDGSIRLKYYLTIPEELKADEGASVVFTKDGEEVLRTPIADGVASGERTVFYYSVVAKEISDSVVLTVVDGNGNTLNLVTGSGKDYSDGFPFSVIQYAQLMQSGNLDAKTKALGKALEDYGVAAQIYFKHGDWSGKSVSAEVLAVTEADLADYVAEKSGDLPAGISKTSLSVMFESDNSLRVYPVFEDGADTAAYTYTVDGKNAALNQRDDGAYYLTVRNIAAKNLDAAHVFTVSDGTSTVTVNASVLGYGRLMIAGSDESAANLGRALYLYNQAANAYFG